MNDNVTLKIFTIVGFLSFATVSCWATSESLHLLLPTYPILLCWIITIGFFFIASWGSKMIVDSLNQNIYMEKRGLTLCSGTIIVLIFWLLCSMPTNTHTFFFRNLIHERVSTDIATTEGYLTQIKDNTVTDARIQTRCSQIKNKVDVTLGELKAEIENDANPGFGPKAKEILSDFADILGVNSIQSLTYVSTSRQARQNLYDAYRRKIYILLESKIENIIKEMTPSNDNYRKVAETDWKNLELVKQYISEEKLSLTDADDVKSVCERLNQGYATISTYQQFVDFKNDADKDRYTASNPETKVKRLLSVYDVWKDFLTGTEGGLGFVFWIIVSILLDIAAFIFFDIAFRKH